MKNIFLTALILIVAACSMITSESSVLKGDAALTLKKYDTAHDSYRNAIFETPDYAEGYRGMGDLRFEQKNYTEALDYYNKAIERDKANAAYYKKRGKVYAATDQYSDAAKDFTQNIKLTEFKQIKGKELEHLTESQLDIYVKDAFEMAETLYLRSKMLKLMNFKSRSRDEMKTALNIYKSIQPYTRGTKRAAKTDEMIVEITAELE